MTPLRKKIIDLARKFDSKIVTESDALWLSATLGSMDDTLTDEEVWSFLSGMAEGRDPEIVISATPRKKGLVKVHVDKNLNVTVVPAPFSKS